MSRVNGIQYSAISTKGSARQCLLRQVVALHVEIRSVNCPYSMHSDKVQCSFACGENCSIVEQVCIVAAARVDVARVKMLCSVDLVIKDDTAIQANFTYHS